MQLSSNGLDFIKNHEGFRPKIYYDSAGLKTIGFGHLIKPSDKFTVKTVLTYSDALSLLYSDLLPFCKCVSSINSKLTQNQFDALVSFCYNVGEGAFLSSTLVKCILKNDFLSASNQFERWVYAGGKVIEGLRLRRVSERDLFLK